MAFDFNNYLTSSSFSKIFYKLIVAFCRPENFERYFVINEVCLIYKAFLKILQV